MTESVVDASISKPVADADRKAAVEPKLDGSVCYCKWDQRLESKDVYPHYHEPLKERPKILNTVLEAIGNTPLIRLNKITASEGIQCEIVAKCEFFNAGGSVKDRVGIRMVEEAEKQGVLNPTSTMIEPTSGNIGIGLALAGAIKGYRTIITLPEKMSREKVDVLKAFGAEIIRTPTEVAFDHPESHIGVARKLQKEIPGAVILDQYTNPYNPLAHFDGTAEEILRDVGGPQGVDMIVLGAGTGGTISGIGSKIKQIAPHVKIVGVDPYGSILAQPEELNTQNISYKVEGIGYDFVPNVLDRTVVDRWIKVGDKEAFLMARRLIKEEGLLCGGSSGSAMVAAIQAAKSLKKGQRCVVILPDSIRNYMSKFLNDEWMIANGFVQDPIIKQIENLHLGDDWRKAPVEKLNIAKPVTLDQNASLEAAVSIMREKGVSFVAVTPNGLDKTLQGVVSLKDIFANLSTTHGLPMLPLSTVMKPVDQLRENGQILRKGALLEEVEHSLLKKDNDLMVAIVDDKEAIQGFVTPLELTGFLVAFKK